MPRQILTFLVIFLLVMFGMRACAPKDTLPPAVVTEPVPESEDTVFTLGGSQGLPTVTLARDGSVVSVRDGDQVILGAVAPWRRAFQLALRFKSGRRLSIPAGAWSKSQETGTGRSFTYNDGESLSVRKLVELEADGNGLRLEFEVAAQGQELAGVELTCASGVPLSGADATKESIVFRRMTQGKLRYATFNDLVSEREQRRGRLLARMRDGEDVPEAPMYYRRSMIDPGQALERLGILGAEHYVVLGQLESARAVNVDVYRAKRGGEESNQIETWVSLDLKEGSYKGTFQLRWGPRARIGELEPDLAQETVTAKAKSHRLENDTLRVDFTDRGAAIEAMWLKGFARTAGQALTEENWVPILRDAVPARHRALILRSSPADRYGANLDNEVWQATKAGDWQSIRFTFKAPTGHLFEKTISLPEEGFYDLEVTVKVVRPDGDRDTSVKYTLIGPSGSYIEDSYRGIIGATPPTGMLLERRGGDSDDEYLESIAKEGEPFEHTYAEGYRRGLLRAVLVRGAFFSCGLVTEERVDSRGRPAGDVIEARVNLLELNRSIERPDGESSRQSLKGQITCAVPMKDGEAISKYRLYAGPSVRPKLKELRIEDAVEFGFFGPIGRFLMWLMKLIESVFGSFGVAIICMTLIVRACLMPISYKTQLGMMRYSKRIQKIKPLLDEVTKKYANNRQKLNQERMRVMREHKVGFPLGCLMIFFQIPIWISLFQALRVEFALRHEPFLWAVDLSMPDRLFGLPFWPHMFNLLPILMLVLWVVQQKLAPSPGGDDPQVQMQMKMVKFMPYMFFIFLYKYAAALSVYMCVSSAWGIVEAKFVRKAIKRAE